MSGVLRRLERRADKGLLPVKSVPEKGPRGASEDSEETGGKAFFPIPICTQSFRDARTPITHRVLIARATVLPGQH
jgi:hypothetical protein